MGINMTKVLEKLTIELRTVLEGEELESLDSLIDELHYLRHFYAEADFGPADDDVREMIKQRYEGDIPKEY